MPGFRQLVGRFAPTAITRWPIRLQIITSASLSLLLLATVFVVYFPARQERAAEQELAGRARRMVDLIAVGLGASLDRGDREAVDGLVTWARAAPYLGYLRIVDSAGATIGLYDARPNTPGAAAGALTEASAHLMGGGRRVGSVSVGLSAESTHTEATRFRLTAIIVAIATLTLSIGAATVLANQIARPIRRLRAAADRIAAGDYQVEIAPSGSNETVRLSEAFQIMANRVRDSHEQLESNSRSLAEARDAALAAARAKSEFLAAMSHEIRTPMNGILGMLGLLGESPLTAKQSDFVRTATSSGNALLKVIDDILDFSKIEAGKLTLDATDFELREAIEGVAQLVAQPAQAKGVELVVMVPDELPRMFRGDPVRLRQVLLNLAGNAVKFTERGSVRIAVSGERLSEDSADLLIEVSDTGIGIPAEVQSRLFQPFVQADGSTTRRFGGTGLGLSISRRLVELMGGTIGVRSTPRQGSVFWFRVTLPLSSAPAPALDSRTLAGRLALVVDDHEVNRSVLRQYLHARDVEVVEASGADEARQALDGAVTAGRVPAVAIIDWAMSDEDGPSLARWIRADERFGAMRLVLLSSITQGSKSPSLDCDAVLSKPVRMQPLLGTLVRVLGDEAESSVGAEVPAVDLDPRARSVRILVAEDNEVNRMLAIEILQGAGYFVDMVANGAEAVEARFRHDYDVILMDCQMPVLDGFAATAEIRRREVTRVRPTPIIAITANAIEGDREACLAAGMNDYLSKPFSQAGLLAMVRRWTGSKGSGGASPREAIALPRTELAMPGTVDPPAPAAINLGRLRDVVGTDDARVVHYLEMFIKLAGPGLAQLADAVEAGDPTLVRQLAHKVKGSCSMVGADAMATIAGQLEQAAQAGSLSTASATMAALHASFDAARAFVSDHTGVAP